VLASDTTRLPLAAGIAGFCNCGPAGALDIMVWGRFGLVLASEREGERIASGRRAAEGQTEACCLTAVRHERGRNGVSRHVEGAGTSDRRTGIEACCHGGLDGE